MRRRLALLALAACAAACDKVPADLAVSGTGAVRGFAFLDRNGSGVLDAGDRPLKGISVSLTDWSTGKSVASATTDSGGIYTVKDVPVGRYRVHVDAAQLGDTLRVTVAADSAVTVTVSDSLAPIVRLGLAYPTLTIAQARSLAVGKPVIVLGRVVGIIGDSVFVWDGQRAIRGLNSQQTQAISSVDLQGDSVRVIGRTRRARGQPVLDSAVIVSLASLPLPAPVALGSGAAANAAGGNDDAAAVRIAAATVVDTVTRSGDSFLRLNDGSGIVDMRIGRNIPFAFTPYVPGLVMNAGGLLVPSSADSTQWMLVPRSTADLETTTTLSPFTPAVPTGIAAAAVDSTITVTWTDASSNETRFQLQRRGNNGSPLFFDEGTVGANVTHFTETAAGNAAYGYHVRACNGVICSAYSDEAIVFTVPAAPTGLLAVGVSGGVKLTWHDVSRVENEFRIERRQPDASFAQVGTVPFDTGTFTETGLTPGTTQTYRVRACNAAGCSPYTAVASAVVQP